MPRNDFDDNLDSSLGTTGSLSELQQKADNLLQQIAKGTAANSAKLIEVKTQLDRIEGKIDRILVGLRKRGWAE